MLSRALKRCVIVSKSKKSQKNAENRDGQGESQVCALDNDVNQRKMGPLHCKRNRHWRILNICFFVILIENEQLSLVGQLQNRDRRLGLNKVVYELFCRFHFYFKIFYVDFSETVKNLGLLSSFGMDILLK